ncbi:6807_t:CDS:2, partial [Cetraspora pellucida]
IKDYSNTVFDTQDNILKIFEEFCICMKAKDRHLKAFFDKLVLLANLLQKKHKLYPKIMSQLLLICYILCGIYNKLIINIKHDLALYLNSTDIGNSTINALAEF